MLFNTNLHTLHTFTVLILLFFQSHLVLTIQSDKLTTEQLLKVQYTTELATKQHTDTTVLTYLTPWNKNGYTYTVDYLHKFTILAPVWYTLKLSTKQTKDTEKPKFHAYIDGNHNVDTYWLTQVHNKSIDIHHTISITPRIIVEPDTASTVVNFIKSKKLQNHVINKIVDLVSKNKYNGIVFEGTTLHPIIAQAYSNTTNTEQIKQRNNVNQFIISISKALKQQNNKSLFIYVVRPYYDNTPYYAYHDLVDTLEYIDYYSLMTYDYGAGSLKPAPNAPIQWVGQSVAKLLGDNINDVSITNKVLLGLNYYGMVWSTKDKQRPIIAHEWIHLLSDAINNNDVINIEYSRNIAEHHITIQHISNEMYTTTLMIPTPYSVEQRLLLAKKLHVGVSIWELGQCNTDLISVL